MQRGDLARRVVGKGEAQRNRRTEMSVASICTRVVATASADETVRDAARRMDKRNVGTLVVVGEDRTPMGILTDRDLVVRCLARDLDPDATSLGEIMTSTPWSVDESTSIEHAVSLMDRRGVRRLVVTRDGGEVSGIVSVDDVILLLATEAARLGGILAKDAPNLDTA